MTDDRLWKLTFEVEVSARYHDWRRATLGGYVAAVEAFSVFGALFAFAAFVAGADQASIIAVGVVASVNVVALVFGLYGKARLHTDLYQRFKELQANIARWESEWEGRLDGWKADAQAIRCDEPPVLWAVFTMCWNQTLERYRLDAQKRSISARQSLLRNWREYRPQDFPVLAA